MGAGTDAVSRDLLVTRAQLGGVPTQVIFLFFLPSTHKALFPEGRVKLAHNAH